jgi:hypothetical protein
VRRAATLLGVGEGYILTGRNDQALEFAGPADSPGVRILIQTGERLPLNGTDDNPASRQVADVETWRAQILAQATPLAGPRDFHPVPDAEPTTVIFAMTGPQDNFLNLYGLRPDGAIRQLTRVEQQLEPAAPALSASADFINWRPGRAGQFLYRSRLRDLQGQDHNRLWLYDLTTRTETPAPYFGKDPVWSPDGARLAGARLNGDDPLLYVLWIAGVESNEEVEIGPGCNPAWSPSGDWLAYDGHVNSQWQG